ncbi:MAG: hypothetical protein ACRDQX_14170, partial [Pseudonocardiaceae bacterium]
MSGVQVTAGRFCVHCAEPAGCADRYCERCGARVADPRRDRVEVDVGVAAGVSDRGRRRRRNEDALALRELSPRAGPGSTGCGSGRRGAAV